MNIIITGASGFIGSHVSRILASHRAQVYACVPMGSDLWRLKDVNDCIEIIETDLLDSSTLKRIVRTIAPNYVFHFAIPSHELLRNESDLQEQIDVTNRHLINLFESIKAHNFKFDSFIHACSGSIYQCNNDLFILNESVSMKPVTLRGKLKLSQRNLCLQLEKTCKVKVKMARIFRAYGPWESDNKLVARALEAARSNKPIPLGNDEFKRDYIFIDDLVRGILSLAKTNLQGLAEINFGGNKQYNAREIVRELEQILGLDIPKLLNTYPKNAYDQGDFIADCTLARRQLGWEPKINIKEGLKSTVDWHKENYLW